MSPPNLPLRPARRPPSLLAFDPEADSLLSPTMLKQPSLLELEDLLEDLKPQKQGEALVLEPDVAGEHRKSASVTRLAESG